MQGLHLSYGGARLNQLLVELPDAGAGAGAAAGAAGLDELAAAVSVLAGAFVSDAAESDVGELFPLLPLGA